jgi:hypothetical protein
MPDKRDPPTYRSFLSRLTLVYKLESLVLGFRGGKTIKGIPINSFRFYGYNLLAHQGVPGGVKTALLLFSYVIPILILQVSLSKNIKYKRDPFHQ